MAWTEEARKKAAESKRLSGRLNNWTSGNYVLSDESRQKMSSASKGRLHTEESKMLMSEKQRASKHRRLRKSVQEYICVDGSIVKMDSSWEVAMAKRLDFLGINWIRPEPFEWIDKEGLKHNYFSDFYLPKYDLYLDPKNPYAYTTQIEKIEWLKENAPNVIFITSLKEIENWNMRQ